jgi:hypothetical protein
MRFPTSRHASGRPPLLASFAAYSLGVVAMVVWVGHDDSVWVLALAVAVTLGLVSALLLTFRRLLGGDPPLAAGRRPRRRTLLLAGLPAVVVPLLAVTMVRAQSAPRSGPAATVRGFLKAAVVDNDGESACAYLTARARLAFEGPAVGRSTCQTFFAGAALDLGGLAVTSDGRVDALDYSVRGTAAAPIVTVSHAGQAIRFTLRQGNEVELSEFAPPATSWRIDAGVSRLAEPSGAGGV